MIDIFLKFSINELIGLINKLKNKLFNGYHTRSKEIGSSLSLLIFIDEILYFFKRSRKLEFQLRPRLSMYHFNFAQTTNLHFLLKYSCLLKSSIISPNKKTIA